MFRFPHLLGVAAVLLAATFLTGCDAYDMRSVEDAIDATNVRPSGTTSAPASQLASGPSTSPFVLPESGPIELTVERAIVLALNNNRDLAVEKYTPQIRRTGELLELSVFDPTLAWQGQYRRARNDLGNIGGPLTVTDSASLSAAIEQFLPTGTTIALEADTEWSRPRDADGAWASRVGGSVTQSLLRGYGLDVNLARLRQARIDTQISLYELRGLAQLIVAQTEQAYWDYALALRQIDIVEQSLDLAQQQLNEIDERIRVGRLAQTERAATEAEVATRRQNLIEADAAAERARLTLLRLISPPNGDPLARQVVLLQEPSPVEIKLDDIACHLEIARRMRPELNQAKLLINRNELEIVRTRNGLLPRLDAFINFGSTGYARSFGRSVGDIDGDSYDVTAGISGDYQLTNRTARATYTRSLLTRDQAVAALENLWQSVDLDVRLAFVEVTRAREQIVAAAATRRLQEVKVRAEIEKFRVNKSTSLQVSQVQRDLLVSQLSEQQAIAAYLIAFVELYRVEGSLLERRGIVAPGQETVELTGRR